MAKEEEKRIKLDWMETIRIPMRIAQYSTQVALPEPLAVRRAGQDDSPVDEEMKKLLENKRFINWLPRAHQLYPLSTPGNGNRLLYAISMAIWGNYDGTKVLMKYMQMALGEPEPSNAIKDRWMLKRKMSGLSSDQLNTEWKRLLKITTAPEFPEGQFEDIHVFVLAVVLHRPIIVLCQDDDHDQDGASCSMNNLAGIYLPLFSDPNNCIKSPIVIGYWKHFMPLLGFDGCQDISRQPLSCVPIVTSDLQPLRVQFLDSEEQPRERDLIKNYLDYIDMGNRVLVAKMEYLSPVADDLIKHIGTENGLKRQCSQAVLASPTGEPCVEIASSGNIPVADDASYENDTCAYPHCKKHAVWWPFCFEHSPDSGWAPGGLLYCWNHFVESKEKPQMPSSTPKPSSPSLVKKCVGPQCDGEDLRNHEGLCEKCYNILLANKTNQ